MDSAKRRKTSHEGANILRPKHAPIASGKQPTSPASTSDPSTEDDPQERSQETEAPRKTFKDLGLVDALCESVAALGYKYPTPVQEQAIPLALKDRDIIGLAETGSGKTAAFALPILQALLLSPKPTPYYGLVLAPTRELATQIGQAFQALGAPISLRVAVIVGGLDFVAQAIALANRPHIIVATPGRLLDHLEKTKGFNLSKLAALVLDEADRMLDLDFADCIDKILKHIPRERRTYLYSATMSKKVESLQRASLRDPLRVSISTPHQVVSTLHQNFLVIPHMHKDTYLVALVNENIGQSTIVFTRTVHETQRLAILLRALGFSAIPLHGQLNQAARLGALNKFKSGSRQILVATDVAARGLDIPMVDLDSKTYIHRVGRTARAGKSGRALSIVTQYDFEIWLRIEAAMGKKIDVLQIDKEEVMVFKLRVEEAQRHAKNEMKALLDNRGKKGSSLKGRRSAKGNKRRADDMDAEEG